MRSAAWVMLALTACSGISEVEFVGEYEDLFCEGYALCATPEMLDAVNHRECLQYFRQQDYPEPPECRFDREAAEQCIEGLRTAGCVGADPEIPQICEDVYTACPFPRVPAVNPETEL